MKKNQIIVVIVVIIPHKYKKTFLIIWIYHMSLLIKIIKIFKYKKEILIKILNMIFRKKK
jgi:hypothetical protein